MKKFVKSLLLVAFASLVFVACEKDPEEIEDFRNRYIGSWSANDREGWNAPAFYDITIGEGSAPDEVIIRGLYNHPNTELVAVVNEYNLIIVKQTTDEITFDGEAKANLDFDQVTFTYIANDGTGDDEVKTVCTR